VTQRKFAGYSNEA